jgi:hypothetical protein
LAVDDLSRTGLKPIEERVVVAFTFIVKANIPLGIVNERSKAAQTSIRVGLTSLTLW